MSSSVEKNHNLLISIS